MSWTFNCKPKSTHFKFKIFNSIVELDENNWTDFVKNNNLFISVNYLKALEESLKPTLNFKYVTFFDNENKIVGVAYMQIISCSEIPLTEADTLSKIRVHIKNKILGVLNIKILVCGNIHANGENGFYFNNEVEPQVVSDNLSNVLFQIRESENDSSKPSMVLLKEFWPDNFDNTDKIMVHDFREFMIDVNMVLKINSSWNSMDDYLASMNTKFRTKAKSCVKKSKAIEIKSLSAENILTNINVIEELYSNVVDSADFQFSKLNAETFLNFKRRLGENFILNGFFLDNKLVGFSTSYINNDVIEAGYIGLDYAYNYKYAVYQKMLYNYVLQGIENKSSELRLGRTAEEIKSSLGAKPINMKLYARHRNSLSNALIKPIIESISPSNFEIRKPFKASF